MRPVTIKIRNWMIFEGDHELELPSGPIAVVARYAEDPDRSNWAGKTAFLEAIDWCLFGTHRKRLDDDVITWGQDQVRVQVTFDTGERATRVRTRGESSRFRFATQGEEREGAVAQDELVERLVMSEAEMRTTTRFRQGDIEGLCSRTSGKRQELLRSWFRLDVFDGAAKRARALLAERVNVAKLVEGDIARCEEGLGGADRDALEAAANVAAEQAFSAKKAREEAMEAYDLAATASARGDRLVDYARLVARGKDLKGRWVDVEPLESAAALAEENYMEARDAERAAEQDMKSARALARGEFDGQCPVTCDACPVADEVRSNAEAGKRRFTGAVSIFKDAAASREAIDRGRSRWKQELKDARAVRDGLKDTATRVVDMRASLGKEFLKLADGDVGSEVERLGAALKEARSARDDAISSASDAERAELVAERALAQHDADASRLEAARERRASAALDVESAALAARALGPSGVPKDVASSRVRVLEEAANAVLEGTGLIVSLSWQRETKQKAPSCVACGQRYALGRVKVCEACGEERGKKMADELEILVDDGTGDPEDVSVKSGGAQVLVGTAFRLAGAATLMALRDSPVSWAVIDEPLGPLDGPNRGRLVTTLATMLGAVGLEQALIVSHDAAVLDALPNRIEILRTGDRATVKVA